MNEGDVADGKADPSLSHQLGQVTVLCIFTMWLLNFFLLEITSKPELQKWQLDREEFYYHALLHHQAVLEILHITTLPLHLLLLIIILPILLLLPLYQEGFKGL